jgi:drug/metabolite transporter (DMT)-like permease
VENKKEVAKLVLANMAIGSLGYGLRFWSIPRIPSVTHSIISYTGIFTTVVYSFLLGIEKVSVSKLGYLGLLASSLLAMKLL